ncbi:thioesterase II family protein [Gordonia hydrophobica]|uniref:Thioesterase TesA n=1 Tax=Gordonia hydrophobica TaxID=40516 RepID=A0ABZ2UAW1_9ACTN|nr:alpha/beta fold hydrolase [Gordonia hydrophobica]MBM7365457.1 surfactin synthase thioesterase subunit [Gordonia hydrophobica]
MTTTTTSPRVSPSRPPALRAFHKPSNADAPVLIVFPHAGGGASSYRELSGLLSAHFDVRIMQYPGRQDRMREPAATALTDLAAEAFDAVLADEQLAGRPIVVFGHSMGSIVAFELTRRLQDADRAPVRLVVSAATAPSRVASLPKHPDSDEELMAHLTGLQGTGGAVMSSESVMRMALPALRADYRAFDAYESAADVRVGVPIQVIGGADDPVIKPFQLHSWSDHADDVEVTVVDGGHFYLNENPAELVAILAAHAAATSSGEAK